MQFFQCITDFIFVEDEPQRSDIIFVPGGNYPEAAMRAAKLYHAGYAPYIMPSGKYSILTGRFVMPETGIAVPEEGCVTRQFVPPETDIAIPEEESRRRCANVDAGDGRAESTDLDGVSDVNSQGMSYATECDYLCDILRQHGVPERAILREDQATFTYENAIFSRRRTEELGLEVHRALLCCQAFHARRSLMYYQEQFPETAFLVCPVVTKGISREDWYRTRMGIDTVLGEVERCGGQFHEILYAKCCCPDQAEALAAEAVRK